MEAKDTNEWLLAEHGGAASVVFQPDGRVELCLPPEGQDFRRPFHQLAAMGVADLLREGGACPEEVEMRLKEIDLEERDRILLEMWNCLPDSDPELAQKLMDETEELHRAERALAREKGDPEWRIRRPEKDIDPEDDVLFSPFGMDIDPEHDDVPF